MLSQHTHPKTKTPRSRFRVVSLTPTWWDEQKGGATAAMCHLKGYLQSTSQDIMSISISIPHRSVTCVWHVFIAPPKTLPPHTPLDDVYLFPSHTLGAIGSRFRQPIAVSQRPLVPGKSSGRGQQHVRVRSRFSGEHSLPSRVGENIPAGFCGSRTQHTFQLLQKAFVIQTTTQLIENVRTRQAHQLPGAAEL